MDLQLLAPGNVIRVTKYRGKPKDYVGRVVETRDLHARPVARKTHTRHRHTRSQYLFTLEALEPGPGVPRFKSFYDRFCQARAEPSPAERKTSTLQ